jgi:hypothetical protein
LASWWQSWKFKRHVNGAVAPPQFSNWMSPWPIVNLVTSVVTLLYMGHALASQPRFLLLNGQIRNSAPSPQKSRCRATFASLWLNKALRSTSEMSTPQATRILSSQALDLDIAFVFSSLRPIWLSWTIGDWGGPITYST